VTAQATELRECKIGITLFDCPSDIFGTWSTSPRTLLSRSRTFRIAWIHVAKNAGLTSKKLSASVGRHTYSGMLLGADSNSHAPSTSS
jgi:hypothetical protein